MSHSAKAVLSIEHYDIGAVRFRGFKLDGEMHGAWEFFRKDGSVMRSGEFDRGLQIGIWRTFDRASRLVKETDFLKGRGSDWGPTRLAPSCAPSA